MAITKTANVERVLIVLNPDGTFKGAHSETLETVSDGDSILGAKYMPPVPLDPATLAAVLPSQGASAATIQALTDALSALKVDRDRAVSALTEERDALAAQLRAIADAAASEITPVQARVALERAGLLTTVEAYMATAPKDVQIYWEYATAWHRQSPFIAAIGATLGLTSTQIDDLFAVARSI